MAGVWCCGLEELLALLVGGTEASVLLISVASGNTLCLCD